jgi:hypothetical protein
MDSLTVELESMRQIAAALDRLQDDDVRRRVLQWAQSRYAAEMSATVAPAQAAKPAPVSDPNLGVEQLADLFEPAAAVQASRVPGVRGVETLIRDFAADFRRFALEWHSA